MAANSYFKDVQKLYLGYYGRAADAEGLAYWANRIDTNGGNLAGIINEFASSAEANKLYGGLSNSARIDKVYNQIFQRSPDSEGMKFYTEQLNNGTYTPGSLVFAIIQGSREQDLVGLNQALDKAMAALDTQAIDAFVAKFAGESNWVAAYAGVNYGGLVLNTDMLKSDDYGLGRTLDSMEQNILKYLTSSKAQEAAVAYLTRDILKLQDNPYGEWRPQETSTVLGSNVVSVKIGQYQTQLSAFEYGAYEVLSHLNQFTAAFWPLQVREDNGQTVPDTEWLAVLNQIDDPILQLAGQYHLDRGQLFAD